MTKGIFEKDYSAPTGLKIRVLTYKQGDALLYVLSPLTGLLQFKAYRVIMDGV